MGLFLRALFYALLAPGTATILVPWLLVWSGAARFDLGPARWIGLLPMAVGVPCLLWCIGDFARTGRGTLAPMDPPKFVVKGGLYRLVRNPMYVSVLSILAGEGLLFQSWLLFAWAACMGTFFVCAVHFYEEPALARQFGGDYEEYRRRVPRWIPWVRPAAPPPP